MQIKQFFYSGVNLKHKLALQLFFILLNACATTWIIQFVFLGKPCFFGSAALLTFFLLFNTKVRLIINTLALLCALLYPVSRTLQDGLLQWASVEVLMTTDFNEAAGFQQSLPDSLLYKAVAMACVFLGFILCNGMLKIQLSRRLTRASFLCVLCIVPVFAFNAYRNLSPRISDMYEAYVDLTVANKQELAKPQWVITEDLGTSKRKYVIVVGESMRKDMMSAYGFPLKTTPNIDALPKRMLSAFITPAAYTIVSVPRLLSIVRNDGSFESQNNAVTLASAAGLKTYWISSQGYSGHWQLGAKILSQYADHAYFSPMGIDDLLLPKISETLQKDEAQAIFVHIIGSHENPCHRLGNFKNIYYTDRGGGNCLVVI